MLVDHELRQLCEEGFLAPWEPTLINPASIDIRIGHTLKRERFPLWNLFRRLLGMPLLDEWVDIDLTQYSEERPYWVLPFQFVLVASLETFKTPDTVTAEFRLKSSSARIGWNNLLAMHIDPGFWNSKLTKELVNHRWFKRLGLWPGQRLGQVLVTRCNMPEASYRTTGRYNNDETVMGSKG
jgi:dCTP deaminase